MKSAPKISFVPLVTSVMGFIVGVVFITWLCLSSNQVVAIWTQPETVHYDGFDPYYLLVIEHGRKFEDFGFRKIYAIYVGRDKDDPSYGHFIDFTFYPGGAVDIETFIRDSKVEWTNDGVTFSPQSGHRLFIPKAMFIGGR
ncbi:MAG TPA: hypothetical protein VHC95_01520 [Opitutales bacterium]|nr:hypothetical protein [Opitutales bacterium]